MVWMFWVQVFGRLDNSTLHTARMLFQNGGLKQHLKTLVKKLSPNMVSKKGVHKWSPKIKSKWGIKKLHLRMALEMALQNGVKNCTQNGRLKRGCKMASIKRVPRMSMKMRYKKGESKNGVKKGGPKMTPWKGGLKSTTKRGVKNWIPSWCPKSRYKKGI